MISSEGDVVHDADGAGRVHDPDLAPLGVVGVQVREVDPERAVAACVATNLIILVTWRSVFVTWTPIFAPKF